MRPIVLVLCLAVAPASVTATAAKAAIFPGLRKKLHEQKLAATQKHIGKSQVAEPVDGPEPQGAPAVVPEPMDVGPDGYPILPAVSNMLGAASGTLKLVNTQASSLEARVVQAQMLSESKMAKQKAAFEEKLKQQEQTNLQVIKANDDIAASIKALKKSNAALRKHAKEIEGSSHVMRTELHTLEARVGLAKDFVAKSLTATDDSKNSLLQVLHGSPHRHHGALVEMSSTSHKKRDDDDDEEEADDSQDDSEDEGEDDDEEEAESFLTVSAQVHRESSTGGSASFEAEMSELDSAVPNVVVEDANPSASPGGILENLSKDVAHLAQQEKESQNNMKQLFIRDFRAGAKRHKALLAKKQGLTTAKASLLALQAKLKSAEAHLEATHAQLEAQLRGLGQFLQKLAHFAMAPQQEVPHLMQALPKVVAVKAAKATA